MKKKNNNPKVHRDLDGFNIEIDSFGEIKSAIDIERINEFLNENVTDLKLEDRKEEPKEEK